MKMACLKRLPLFLSTFAIALGASLPGVRAEPSSHANYSSTHANPSAIALDPLEPLKPLNPSDSAIHSNQDAFDSGQGAIALDPSEPSSALDPANPANPANPADSSVPVSTRAEDLLVQDSASSSLGEMRFDAANQVNPMDQVRPVAQVEDDDDDGLFDDNEGLFDDDNDPLDDELTDDDDDLIDEDEGVLEGDDDPTIPPTDAPDDPFDVDTETVSPGRTTRSSASYIGIGGNIGIGDGDTALGESSFAAFSKIGLTSNISVRPSVLIDDDPTILIPLTLDFVPGVTEVTEDLTEDTPFRIAPYVGAGAAISTGDDTTVDFLATGGIDVPIGDDFTATAAVNVTLFDDPAVGLLLGIGVNFPSVR
jgi:hypothetical protein